MIGGAKIGLGILSYRAHDSLRQTLSSYAREKLEALFDDKVVYFNDFSEPDRQLADSFGYRAEGGPNIGFKAQEQLARHLDAEYVLLTQNDCPLVEDGREAERQLAEAVELLASGTIDLMRFRHRWRVGEGFSDVVKYAGFYNVHKVDENFLIDEHGLDEEALRPTAMRALLPYLRPFKARRLIGRSVYIEERPERLFPRFITRKNGVLIVDSACIDYTEQSFLISRSFFLEVLCRYINEHPKKRTLHGFQVPEYILNCHWWRKRHFKIGVCRGLFTHSRLDDSFRKQHRAYNAGV